MVLRGSGRRGEQTVNGSAARGLKAVYSRGMLLRYVVPGMPLFALPAAAADSSMATGANVTGGSLTLFALALALVAALLLRRLATRIGAGVARRIGEARLRRILAKRGAKVLSDFIVPGAYGGLARIDHAVMTTGGILCVRVLHFDGVVLGTEEEAQWTHVDGITRRRFLNPAIQNEGRRRALANVVPDVPVDGLVVFTGKVEFPNALPKGVIHVAALNGFLARQVFGPSRIDDWDAVWMSVKAAALTDEGSRRDFAAQLSFS